MKPSNYCRIHNEVNIKERSLAGFLTEKSQQLFTMSSIDITSYEVHYSEGQSIEN